MHIVSPPTILGIFWLAVLNRLNTRDRQLKWGRVIDATGIFCNLPCIECFELSLVILFAEVEALYYVAIYTAED